MAGVNNEPGGLFLDSEIEQMSSDALPHAQEDVVTGHI